MIWPCMGNAMSELLKYRRALVIALHLVLISLANYLAFWLRFDGVILQEYWDLLVGMLPWLLVIRGVAFIPFRLYEGLWRYTSIWDLGHIIAGVGLSSTMFYVLVHVLFGYSTYPRSVFVIDSTLLILILGGVRLTRRIYREFSHVDHRKKRVLIYGAGDAGEMIVRDMLNNPFYEYEPIGFLDDDPAKVGQRIHGVKVLGTREDLPEMIAGQNPDLLLVAIARIGPPALRKLVKLLERFALPIETIPNFRDFLDGKVAISQLRNLAIEDLLERAPVGLDPEPIKKLMAGRAVLVTGAGGSIGSELCRQILRYDPARLVLVDRYENGLHELVCELTSSVRTRCQIEPLIADVTDRDRIASLLDKHRHLIIFHAAAHKHVPLMEVSPCEAIKNNVIGTRVLVECAARCEVERFLLISTDKAVNPTSVMGASKRVAELIVQSMNGPNNGHGVFSVVRFGNVLGSNGSVVPRFLQQIKAGGPVTVTHPEMRRFFMLIPEAVQLVLHAAALARGGEIYTLEMGEQVKIVEMAKQLIRLSGFIPEEEIPITFVGMRPGEKLYEQLVASDEIGEPSNIRQILQIRPVAKHLSSLFQSHLQDLENLARKGDAEGLKRLLKAMLPTFQPDNGMGQPHGRVCESDQAVGQTPLPAEGYVA